MPNLIVIPAFNEEESLPITLAELESLPEDFEIVVINDGSRDRTAEVALQYAETSKQKIHVVDLPSNCGIGLAVQTGYKFARRQGDYDYVIQFDADGQHPAEALPLLVEECRTKELDLCVGSRFLDEKPGGFRSTFFRRVGIRFFAKLIGLLSGTRVTDPTSGLRCAGRSAWMRFAEHYPEDYPEPESLFWCARNRLKIGEIPVHMHSRKAGVSSIRAFRSVYYMLKVTIAIILDRLRRKEFWK